MRVDISHLVLEAFCDTDNQVVNQRSDCAEGSNVLAGAMVEFNVDDILLRVGEVDRKMAEVLGELAWWWVRGACCQIEIPAPYLGDPRL